MKELRELLTEFEITIQEHIALVLWIIIPFLLCVMLTIGFSIEAEKTEAKKECLISLHNNGNMNACFEYLAKY